MNVNLHVDNGVGPISAYSYKSHLKEIRKLDIFLQQKKISAWFL